LPQTSANHTPIKRFIVLSRVESTNNYAMAKLHASIDASGFCFFALEQTAGKGQRGKTWTSNPGENITMSTVFPLWHRVSANVSAFPFLLSAAMALGCYDFIKDCNIPNLSIKWPNDIYFDDRKAAGILIENVFKSPAWRWAVIGTGVNINQQDFPVTTPNAVSLKMITGKTYNVIELGKKLHTVLTERFSQLSSSDTDVILDEYNSRLYRKGQEVKLKKDNTVFKARIDQVNANGELVTYAGVERTFRLGEVEFIP
jgi:BirA family transcriptional regulator, biotin operon repressor / biotin---[acetyl-CoA-carboxylase] ligase